LQRHAPSHLLGERDQRRSLYHAGTRYVQHAIMEKMTALMGSRRHATRLLVAAPVLVRPRIHLAHSSAPSQPRSRGWPSSFWGNCSVCRSFTSGTEYTRIVSQVSDVPHPKQLLETNWVSDPHRYLRDVDRSRLNTIIAKMHRKHGVEVAIVLMDACGPDLRPFLRSLFDEWGIGCKNAHNGFLIAMVMGKRRQMFVTGDGLDAGVLDHFVRDEIRETIMAPQFHEGKLFEGLKFGLEEIAMHLDEWPDGDFVADWVKEGGSVREGSSFSGGRSSSTAHEGRWMWPEKVTLAALTIGAVCAVGFYIEDALHDQSKRKCPKCNEMKLKRNTEMLKLMTCDPWEDGSKCEHIRCQGCGYYDVVTWTLPASHSYATSATCLQRPTLETEGLEKITNTCRSCDIAESIERVMPKLVKRRAHVGI